MALPDHKAFQSFFLDGNIETDPYDVPGLVQEISKFAEKLEPFNEDLVPKLRRNANIPNWSGVQQAQVLIDFVKQMLPNQDYPADLAEKVDDCISFYTLDEIIESLPHKEKTLHLKVKLYHPEPEGYIDPGTYTRMLGEAIALEHPNGLPGDFSVHTSIGSHLKPSCRTYDFQKSLWEEFLSNLILYYLSVELVQNGPRQRMYKTLADIGGASGETINSMTVGGTDLYTNVKIHHGDLGLSWTDPEAYAITDYITYMHEAAHVLQKMHIIPEFRVNEESTAESLVYCTLTLRGIDCDIRAPQEDDPYYYGVVLGKEALRATDPPKKLLELLAN